MGVRGIKLTMKDLTYPFFNIYQKNMQKSVARVFAWFCCVAAAVAFGPNPGGNGHPPGGVEG